MLVNPKMRIIKARQNSSTTGKLASGSDQNLRNIAIASPASPTGGVSSPTSVITNQLLKAQPGAKINIP